MNVSMNSMMIEKHDTLARARNRSGCLLMSSAIAQRNATTAIIAHANRSILIVFMSFLVSRRGLVRNSLGNGTRKSEYCFRYPHAML